MDGLSSAASGIAVVSLAMQLADGLWKLNKFFDSIQDAPAQIQGISTELSLLSQIVRNLVPHESAYHEVLENVKYKVQNLQDIVAKVEPGLKSDRKSVRRWAAFKTVTAGSRIRTFRASLEETKVSLMLGLQASTLAVQRKHSELLTTGNTFTTSAITTAIMESVRNELQMVKSGSASGKPQQSDGPKIDIPGLHECYTSQTIVTETTTEFGHHEASLQMEVHEMAARITNPVVRSGFLIEMHSTVEMQFSKLRKVKSDGRIKERVSIAKLESPSVDSANCEVVYGQDDKQHICDPELVPPPQSEHSSRSKPVSLKNDGTKAKTRKIASKVLVETKQYSMNRFFGKVMVLTEVWRLSSPVRKIPGRSSADRVEWSTRFHFYPAPWLLQCGLAYGCSMSVLRTQRGWTHSFEAVRAVPDDSLVFDMAYTGNLKALELMFYRGKASILDTDSRGWTPLAWAAYGMHTPTIKWLIEHGADIDTTVRSHRDKHQTNDYKILELAAGSRGINHGDRPIGTKLSPRLQGDDLFGVWIDEISFETDGIGWDLVTSLIGSCYRDLGLHSLKSAVIWIFSKYRTDIERGIRIAPWRLRDMYYRALWAGRGDLVDIVATYFGLAQDHPSFDGFGALQRLLWRMIGEVEEARISGIVGAVRCLLNNGMNPHIAGREEYFSAHLETALSIAMYNPGAFWHWRNILRCLHLKPDVYFEDELHHESRLTELGWTKEAFLALYKFDYSLTFFNERSTCRDCNTYFYFAWGKWWDEVQQSALEKGVIDMREDEFPQWRPFNGWTADLRDDYFKGWIQMKDLEMESAYLKMGAETEGHKVRAEDLMAIPQPCQFVDRTPSHSSGDFDEHQSSSSEDASQGMDRTPSHSSTGSGRIFIRSADATARVASSGTPSNAESEDEHVSRTSDGSSKVMTPSSGPSEGVMDSDSEQSRTDEVPRPRRLWWRYRLEEEQRCPACRHDYQTRMAEVLELGRYHLPGAFPM